METVIKYLPAQDMIVLGIALYLIIMIVATAVFFGEQQLGVMLANKAAKGKMKFDVEKFTKPFRYSLVFAIGIFLLMLIDVVLVQFTAIDEVWFFGKFNFTIVTAAGVLIAYANKVRQKLAEYLDITVDWQAILKK